MLTTAANAGLYARNLLEHREPFESLELLQPQVEEADVLMSESLIAGGKLMFCGNGGSAADSQHIAAELTGRLVHDRRPLAAMALGTDTSALTCIANDYSLDQVFERQLIGLGRPPDCLVGISTSGNSENVLRAMKAANRLGLSTIGLLGRDGGARRAAVLCERDRAERHDGSHPGGAHLHQACVVRVGGETARGLGSSSHCVRALSFSLGEGFLLLLVRDLALGQI